jgi:hypothetical protein
VARRLHPVVERDLDDEDVVVRGTLITAATPPEMRGRVSGVEVAAGEHG